MRGYFIISGERKMALPIKPTPHLKGKDAEKFHKEMIKAQGKKISAVDRARMEKNYKEMSEAFKKNDLI